MKYNNEAVKNAYNRLTSIRNGVYHSLKSHEYLLTTFRPYATVTSVSKSGMSRTIKYYVIDANKELHNITYFIAILLNEPYDDNKGVRVRGVGMDMIFDTLYRLNGAMIDNDANLTDEQKQQARQERGLYDYFITTNYRRI